MDSLTISNMCFDDIPYIKNIEQEQNINILSTQNIKEDLKNSCYHYFIAKKNEQIVGYIAISKVDDEVSIISLAVKKEYQSQGVASSLLNYIFNLENVKRILLEVRKSNTKAIKLYEKFNFSHYYTRKNYYDNGEDALLYEKII